MGYRSFPRRTSAAQHDAAPAPRRPAVRRAALAVLCAVLMGCGQAQGEEAPRGLMGELARELDGAIPIAPRLSISAPGGPCIRGTDDEANARCADASAESAKRIAAIAVRAEQAVREGADPQAMHAAALIDLLYDGGGGKSLGRSISSLQTAARLSEQPAGVLADLAAAYLVRAERAGTPRDLLAALEAAEQALEHQPEHRAAAYNRALALERFGLVEEAGDAWQAYAAADSATGWGLDARRRQAGLQALPAEAARPSAEAPEAAYAAYAAADPQRARELGWCHVLGAWGTAAIAGEGEAAAAHLRRAEALGAALERRPGGDATLADGIRAIHAAAHPAGRERLARAHAAFAAGCEAARQVDFAEAAAQFGAVARQRTASPALHAWASLLHGRAEFHGGNHAAGEAAARGVLARADSARHPALAGGARLLLSVILLRSDHYDGAAEQAERARIQFASAGERESEGAALEVLSTARFGLRDADGGYALAALALHRLRPYRGSHRLHNVLASLANDVAEDGFPRAAVRILGEGVRVAERTGLAVYVMEARLIRAQLLAGAGAHPGAARDIQAAEAALARTPGLDPTVRAWMLAQRSMAQSPALLRTDPARAARALDAAAAFFIDTMEAPLLGFPALVHGAEARLAAGDTARGTALLQAALEVLEDRRDVIRMQPRRAAVFEEARALVDRVTMLRLAAGQTADALRYLDRGRASLTSVGSAAPAPADGPVGPPAGEVALAYALVGDTLLAWTVAGTRVDLYRAPIDTVRLARTVAVLRRQLEDRAGAAELRPALAQLYDWLIRPVLARLGGAETPLVVIPDGELGSIPFAALYDARRGRYLVEDHPTRFAASLREAARPPAGAAAGEPLFVADPAFDAAAFPEFARLAQAAEEVREIAAGYADARVLAGPAATGASFRRRLAASGVLHYAGHAVFDDERPERSYLLLAPAGTDGGGVLTAGEVAEMDLRHLRLVVLAACQTVRTGTGRAAGFSGLAGAFLAAGAGGAIGSLWQVDERLTRPLMVEFHTAYRNSSNAVGALRTAQLRLLRSGDAALQSPAAWAGFRYAGR